MPPNLSKALPKSEKRRLLKLVEIERARRKSGYRLIAGVDEAGRGPLAGPLVACACLIEEDNFFPYVNDCKLLTPAKREEIYLALASHQSVVYALGVVDAALIDEINIHQATIRAMQEAVSKLSKKPDYVLVDGLKVTFDGIPSERIVKGDQKCHCIAAASVMAKVERDKLMHGFHHLYPQYGFDKHKGYGTQRHKEALKEHGLSPIHRRSFGKGDGS